MKSILISLTILLIGAQPVLANPEPLDIMGNAINPDVVTIYAYRPKKWGAALMVLELEMTDLEGIVALKNKTHFIHTTDLDGSFEFEGALRDVPEDFEIFTELGNVYYVRCFINDKGVVARPGFELVDAETAKKDMKKSKPAKIGVKK